VQISPECDALQLCGILSAAIIAFRAPLHRKLIGIALGVAWLQIVNFARIVSLFFVGASKAVPFDTAHEVVWPAVLIAITIATWIVWARRIPIEEAPA
jgi:exosortase/archaeosortase family protein